MTNIRKTGAPLELPEKPPAKSPQSNQEFTVVLRTPSITLHLVDNKRSGVQK